jgi:hypothetical protein
MFIFKINVVKKNIEVDWNTLKSRVSLVPTMLI